MKETPLEKMIENITNPRPQFLLNETEELAKDLILLDKYNDLVIVGFGIGSPLGSLLNYPGTSKFIKGLYFPNSPEQLENFLGTEIAATIPNQCHVDYNKYVFNKLKTKAALLSEEFLVLLGNLT